MFDILGNETLGNISQSQAFSRSRNFHVGIRKHPLPDGFVFEGFSIDHKLPIVGTPIFELISDARMHIEIMRCRRKSIALKMFACRNHYHLHRRCNRHGDHALTHITSQSDPCIKLLFDNIDEPILTNEFQSNIRITLLKHLELRQEYRIDGMLTCIDPHGA